ncbi:MAG: DUF4864 domain-containing protein [Candidatus Nanopelagicaceae bacterium]|nr:DUF4864 domain-containing protein [Candidatus Nanopelagicaceae bacterium]
MTRLRGLTLAIIMVVLASLNSIPQAQAKNGACSQQQRLMLKKHITKQINAIAKSDWESAYSYAAQTFQSAVPIDVFEEIIKGQYEFLIYNDGFGFGSCKNSKNNFNQVVNVDFQGEKRIISYGLTLVGKRLGVVAASEIKPSNSTVV